MPRAKRRFRKRHMKRSLRRLAKKSRASRSERKNGPAQSLSRVRFPYYRHKIIPDVLDVAVPVVLEFHTTNPYGTGGTMAYMNVCGSSILAPFQNPGAGPTFVAFNATVPPGFGGVLNSGYGGGVNPNFYAAISELYNSWFVKGSTIEVEMILGNSNSECDLAVVPIDDANFTTMFAVDEARYSKRISVYYYAGGETRMTGKVRSSMSTRRLYGLSASNDSIRSSLLNTGGPGVQPTQYLWNWQICTQNKFGQTSASADSIRVHVMYYVTFFNPFKSAA